MVYGPWSYSRGWFSKARELVRNPAAIHWDMDPIATTKRRLQYV